MTDTGHGCGRSPQVCIYHAELTLILSGAIQKRTLPFVGFLEAGAASTTMVMVRKATRLDRRMLGASGN